MLKDSTPFRKPGPISLRSDEWHFLLLSMEPLAHAKGSSMVRELSGIQVPARTHFLWGKNILLCYVLNRTGAIDLFPHNLLFSNWQRNCYEKWFTLSSQTYKAQALQQGSRQKSAENTLGSKVPPTDLQAVSVAEPTALREEDSRMCQKSKAQEITG